MAPALSSTTANRSSDAPYERHDDGAPELAVERSVLAEDLVVQGAARQEFARHDQHVALVVVRRQRRDEADIRHDHGYRRQAARYK